jgi:hypothetical protein
MTNNNFESNLFYIEKITYFDSSFHDKSTDIIFVLLAFMVILLFTLKLKKFDFEKF